MWLSRVSLGVFEIGVEGVGLDRGSGLYTSLALCGAAGSKSIMSCLLAVSG